ncbi:MAG: TRCF domain-containing protein, partial [Myxococcota bacterium]
LNLAIWVRTASRPGGGVAMIDKFSDNVIREAVMRELSRGGQVYFVHNRVKTIHEMATHLSELLPEARIAVGHGQMREQELEKVMVGFVRREFNVLLSTTIIESGLDISNANTMLIDRADNFGLSQLYQLRGRIGRSRERAYCYLLVRNKRLTDIAQQRLDVIERFSDLGSGFQVASYDLEIRGAGNILGPEQSGSVAAVGLDLYTELLEEAIAEVRGEEVKSDVEPEVNVPVPAYLPEGYIHDTSLRLLFYKRLSLARDQDELDDLYTELHDRFGEPPQEVESLREVIGITIALKELRCPRLDAGPGVIQITLGNQPALTPDEVISLIHLFRGRYVLTPNMLLLRHLKPEEAEDPLKAARMVCRELLEAAGFA